MINGIINIRKEAGYTSHDVVAKLRGILKQRKIGHTGTLDPDATGVLPVCLGKATKLCNLIGDWEKTYEAVLLLGRTTDTEDTSGTVLSRSPVTVSEEEIRRILKSFEGDYEQIPPMYSAKKMQGRRLYELAREGITVEREPCHVHISRVTIREIRLPEVSFSVTCSKGTYIRSLCRDAGEKAGCGGCMASLVRSRVAGFDIENSLTLSEVEKALAEGRLDHYIIKIDSVFRDYPKLMVGEEGSRLLMNGNPVPISMTSAEAEDNLNPLTFRVYDRDEHFIGLYKNNPKKKRLEPLQLFFDI
ncbi:MAG: tRNA pseudouridine(55) synthase TruB [Eubacterium sp.]|nr:tRNA pseudouridine(55) synthase TruB [Eubacterium sp.]